MKNKAIFIIALISLVILNMEMMNAEERPIYVGDMIELNIDNTYSIADIELAFEGFDIVDLIEKEDLYELKIRSFDVGEHSVTLGDTEVIISITTLLSDDKIEIMNSEIVLNESGMVLPWTSIKIISLLLSLVGLVTFIVLIIKSRPQKPLSNIDTLMIQLNTLKPESDDYAYHLTSMFKTYSSTQLGKALQGLTTNELLNDIKELSEVKESYELMRLWFNKCDTFKYSKDKANPEAKLLLKQELLNIVESIEKTV